VERRARGGVPLLRALGHRDARHLLHRPQQGTAAPAPLDRPPATLKPSLPGRQDEAPVARVLTAAVPVDVTSGNLTVAGRAAPASPPEHTRATKPHAERDGDRPCAAERMHGLTALVEEGGIGQVSLAFVDTDNTVTVAFIYDGPHPPEARESPFSQRGVAPVCMPLRPAVCAALRLLCVIMRAVDPPSA
jgi:hypothetical protein